MKCLNVISVSWSKILFTRTDYKFGVALFFFLLQGHYGYKECKVLGNKDR